MRANIADDRYDVRITEAGQWRSLAPGADAIVDPMVFRAADVFLSGATGSDAMPWGLGIWAPVPVSGVW
jgi:hypothetical protein